MDTGRGPLHTVSTSSYSFFTSISYSDFKMSLAWYFTFIDFLTFNIDGRGMKDVEMALEVFTFCLTHSGLEHLNV